jgi:hypothetical protein
VSSSSIPLSTTVELWPVHDREQATTMASETTAASRTATGMHLIDNHVPQVQPAVTIAE